jgi:thiosulfate dehydrogenase [quinone] large subunit
VGLLINLVFFLSADWHVFPYFYGSDIVFLFCWLTLLIAGPASSLLPALDTRLVLWLVDRVGQNIQQRVAVACEFVFGIKVAPTIEPIQQPAPVAPRSQALQQSASRYKAWQLEQARQQGRRNFIWGTLSGGAGMLVLAWLAGTLHLLPGSGSSDAATGTSVAPTLGSPATGGTPTPVLANGAIAKISAVPVNSSTTFTLPSNGDPGILVHLDNNQFVAFDATCTHAGCPVDYDPASKNLVCPCHGAAFDPTKAAAVITGPAQTPLTAVPIKVDQNAGTVSLG